jgi:hypothetical protein
MIETDSEKRKYPRFEVDAVISIRAFDATEWSEETIEGRIVDISEGGLCLETKIPLTVSSPVRCKIPLSFAKFPISVPSLLQVRWTREGPRSHEYRSGLQFLL